MFDNLTLNTTHVSTGCCGCHFRMESAMYESLCESHKIFYCPKCGERRHFGGQTDKERAEAAAKRAQELLERERAETARLRESRAKVERQLSAQRGATKRVKNRVKNGVCPCCTRSFGNLAAHMKTKHPTYAKGKD